MAGSLKPKFTIELLLHPDSSDGRPNAWKILMRDEHDFPVLADTAATAPSCLAIARDFLTYGDEDRTLVVDPVVVACVEALRGRE